MANWKKIIVSGSDAHLASITSSVLTNDNILVAGTGGAVESSGITYNGSTLGLGTSIITSTGAASILSGSFSGSFQGDGSNLTGLVTELNLTGSTGNITIDLLTEDLTVASGNSISTAAAGNTVTVAVIDGGITETQLKSSVAGTGLSGGGGTVLSVDYGSTAGTAAQGNTGVTFLGTAGEIELSTNTFTTLGGGGAVTVGLPNDVSVSNNLTVGGDLVVNGTTTTLNTQNLLVEDRFILLNSGSANPDEGGLVIDEGSGTGHALIYEADAGITRWGFNESVNSTATTANTTAYASAVVDLSNSNHADNTEYQKNGNIKVDTGGDIWIYS